jgi:hypothetical protein
VSDKVATASGNLVANGTFSSTADWAAVAVEIRAGSGNAATLPAGIASFESAPVYALYPSSPNPFNPQTRIRFSLPRAGRAHLAVYDIAGRLVATLADGVLEAGPHARLGTAAPAGGRPLASGVYICRLRAAGQSSTTKLILAR